MRKEKLKMRRDERVIKRRDDEEENSPGEMVGNFRSGETRLAIF